MPEAFSLLGILLSLALLMWLAFRGWSVLLLAPMAAGLAATLSGFPLLASWTQVFMPSAATFLAQFFPLFVLGALFGKLMNDSGSVEAIADLVTRRLGARRSLLAVVLAGALMTYGGVSLFVAFFVLAPMALALFRSAGIPRRLAPAAIMLGTSTFTMTALPGTPAIQNVIPMPFFDTTIYAAPGLGIMAAVIMLGLGMGWLTLAERRARLRGETFEAAARGPGASAVREHAISGADFDPAEVATGAADADRPPAWIALAPFAVMISANLVLSLLVLPRIEMPLLARPEWGATTIARVAGVWSVAAALMLAIVSVVALNRRRLKSLRDSMGAGANAAALPALSVASLVGFGGVVAALPAFHAIRDWVLGFDGGPVVSLAVATNLLAAMTGSASGGLSIALEALGATYREIAEARGIDPALMHRVAAIGAGTLDILPHNGAVVTLLSLCGATHRESYVDIAISGILPALAALAAVVALGSMLGAF
ncbi:GntP family permease [Phenylobacterium sp.]|uniref:GntP family permease n=1 Tax=Phenylobacterium sp. TaxID=1871053 RepID=UPI00301D4077